MVFDRNLISKAMQMFYRVYVDDNRTVRHNGRDDIVTGYRVRIYVTSWEYEEAEIFRSNKELAAFINKWKGEQK